MEKGVVIILDYYPHYPCYNKVSPTTILNMNRLTASTTNNTAYNEFISNRLVNTLIIAPTAENDNLRGNGGRDTYLLKAGKNVCKSFAKKVVLHLKERRVANGPLFNNESLIQPRAKGTKGKKVMVTVGLCYMGAERRYTIPIVWRKDGRGNNRRYITQAQFLLLPVELQETAAAMGVDVSGDLVTLSRCIAAWAGHTVTDMHVHHVNMCTTDDRLGNLHVLTPSEHAAIHANKEDLLWDEEWYEYNSYSEAIMRLNIALLLNQEEHLAKDITPPQVPLPHYMAPTDQYLASSMQYFVDAPKDHYGDDGYGLDGYLIT